LLPLVGWFVLLPASFIIGAGAATRSLIKHLRKGPKPVPTVKEESIPDFGSGLGTAQ